MVDVINATDVPNDDLATTTDGYPDTSAHAYQMGVDQNLTEDEYWLHYNTTDVYQFFLNVTTDSETAKDEITIVLRMFMWILSLFILTCNGLTIIVVMKYIKKVTPTHVVIAFLAFAGLFVGILPIFSLVGDSVQSKRINDLNGWVTIAARSLSISGIVLIAVERCFLVTSLKLYQKYLTVRRQVGLCIAFCISSCLIATIFTLMTDSGLKNGKSYKVILGKRSILYALFLPIYAFKTCILGFCYLKIYLFLWKNRKHSLQVKIAQTNRIFKRRRKQQL